MKRDIKLNMLNLRAILYKINEYKSELEVIESASARFLEAIKEQDSKAYDRLAALWEKNVALNERELGEKLETISKILNNYICDMESYITPNNPSAMLRVDRNDIWRNCGQIEQNTVYESYFDEILCDTSSSFADYKKCFVYNPFENEETNNARKAAQQAEEEAERKRREANYAQLEDFRTTLRTKMQGSLKTSVDNIWKMYEEVIILFENTDDEYKKKLDGYYDEWSDIGDKFRDVTDVIADVGSGFGHAATDLLTGIGNMLSGVGKLLGWLALQIPIFEECGLVPETLEETWEQELKETWTGIKAILSEPEDALGAIAQSVIDTADEKGVAYSVGYVTTDIVSGILLDKGLGKVSKLGKTDDVAKYVDEVTESANKAGKHTDDMVKGINKYVGESGSGSEFKYEHNPSDNPKVLVDAIEDPTAVYGYSPNPNSKSIGGYVNNIEQNIDWSDPEKVADYRRRREIYHMKNDNIDELVIKMKKEGFSAEEIARAANKQRNQNRLNDYIVNNDMKGLARAKKRNLEKYGHEFGLDADDVYEMYGSWEKVIEKSMSANPGMDACCGLYDKYYHLYEIKIVSSDL